MVDFYNIFVLEVFYLDFIVVHLSSFPTFYSPLPSMPNPKGIVATAASHAFNGMLASLAAVALFYPLDTIKTRRQIFQRREIDRRSELPISKEDFVDLYKGLDFKMMHTLVSSFVFHFWLQCGRELFMMRKKSKGCRGKMTVRESLLVSTGAAIVNIFFSLPLDGITTRMQANAEDSKMNTDDSANHAGIDTGYISSKNECNNNCGEEDKNSDGANDGGGMNDEANNDQRKKVNNSYVSDLLPERFPKHLWRGLTPAIFLAINPAIHYTFFDYYKDIITSNEKMSMLEAFFCGLAAKSTATLVTYPLIRTKVKMIGGGDQDHSFVEVMRNIYKDEGAPGFCRGIELQLGHTTLKAAFLMMVREYLS